MYALCDDITWLSHTRCYDIYQPWLERKLKIHDTCGVNNLHGIPGIMGTVLSIIMAAAVNKDEYNGDKKY